MNKYEEAYGSLCSVFKYEPMEKIDEERKENLQLLKVLKELVDKTKSTNTMYEKDKCYDNRVFWG